MDDIIDGSPGALPGATLASEPTLADIVDVAALQSVLEDFHALTSIGMAIVDVEGTVLAKIGWQDICTQFHRVHPDSCRHCVESDTRLSEGVAVGCFKLYKCRNNMWDLSTPIVMGDRRLGNLFMGQFFFEDETPDVALFREQARRYGYDEAAYLAALARAPKVNRETVERAMALCAKLAALISRINQSNNHLAAALGERDQLLRSMRESEERLRLLVESMPVMVNAFDAAGLFVFWNRECERVTGYSADEIINNPNALRMLYPTPGYLEAKLLELAENQDRYRECEWELTCKDGSRKIAAFSNIAHQVALPGWSTWAIGVDVTDRRRAESELKRREALLRKIVEILPIGLWFADHTGKLLSGNPAGIRIWGAEPHVSPEEYGVFKARRLPSGEEIAPDDWALAHTIRDGLSVAEEMLEIEGFDGIKRIILNYTAPVLDDGGALQGAIVVNQDITALKRAEDERRKLDMQIQQTQKLESLGVLAGGIAHDFNNILMAVLGHADLALEEISPLSPARDNLMEIERAARRAAELCRQMLAYAGRASFALERVDLRELIEEMAHLLKTTISKKAVLNLRFDKELPSIQADAGQMRQIIMNLIINASEAVGERSGAINIALGAAHCDAEYLKQTELDDDLPPGRYLCLEVADTGCGMSPETRARLFEPFFTTKFTGRGLGMAAVLGIMRAHGGAVKVYSEVGRGSVFKLFFPALEDAAIQSESVRAESTAWRGSGRILLVDDEASIRAVCAKLLEHIGFSVMVAADGREAVECYRQAAEEIDLVLMDLTMPHMDGEQAYRALRAINPAVRVVLASGYSREDVAARFAGKGLAGVLQKPYTLTRLREALSAALK